MKHFEIFALLKLNIGQFIKMLQHLTFLFEKLWFIYVISSNILLLDLEAEPFNYSIKQIVLVCKYITQQKYA